MNNRDMQRVLHHLRQDPVVRAVYDAKSEEIGPNIFRFKAEIGGAPAVLHSALCHSGRGSFKLAWYHGPDQASPAMAANNVSRWHHNLPGRSQESVSLDHAQDDACVWQNSMERG